MNSSLMSPGLPIDTRNAEQPSERTAATATNSIDIDRQSDSGKCTPPERLRDSHAPTLTDLDAGAYLRHHRCSRCGHLSSTCKSDIIPGDEKTELRDEKSYLITEFDGPDDPDNPKNFSSLRKVLIVALTSSCTFCVSFASSIFSTCTEATAAEFGVSEEVMILGVSLYVLGFAFGPLIWGPVSERYGRYYPTFTGLFIFVIFQIPLAVAQNLDTICLSWFLAGFFGSAPLGLNSATYVDILGPVHRGVAIAVFASSVFLGPTLGPIVGSFVTESYLGWRWTAWITMIIAGLCTGLGIIIVPETSVSIRLQRKAKRRRLEMKEWAWHSKLDESSADLKELAQKYLQKPFRMLICEPILVAMTAYIALVYSILYLIFFAYPIAFQMGRGWKPGIASLPFLSLMIGIICASVGMAIDSRTRVAKKIKQQGKLVPEDRLAPMIIGGIALLIGLFWFAWTSNPHINFWPQIIAGVPIGAGITSIFFPGLLYITDVYLANAASGLAANCAVRSLSAAGFPLFATYMYRRLGVAWATSLLGFLCTAMVPIPILLFFYGHRLREKGTFTFAL